MTIWSYSPRHKISMHESIQTQITEDIYNRDRVLRKSRRRKSPSGGFWSSNKCRQQPSADAKISGPKEKRNNVFNGLESLHNVISPSLGSRSNFIMKQPNGHPPQPKN